MPEDIMEFPHL